MATTKQRTAICQTDFLDLRKIEWFLVLKLINAVSVSIPIVKSSAAFVLFWLKIC